MTGVSLLSISITVDVIEGGNRESNIWRFIPMDWYKYGLSSLRRLVINKPKQVTRFSPYKGAIPRHCELVDKKYHQVENAASTSLYTTVPQRDNDYDPKLAEESSDPKLAEKSYNLKHVVQKRIAIFNVLEVSSLCSRYTLYYFYYQLWQLIYTLY